MMAKLERWFVRASEMYAGCGLLTAIITWFWYPLSVLDFIGCALLWPIIALMYILFGIDFLFS